MKSAEQWAKELLPGRSATYRKVFEKAFQSIQDDARSKLLDALEESKRAIAEHHSSNIMADEHTFCPWCASEEGRKSLSKIYNAEINFRS